MSMASKLNRRDFLKAASIAAAGGPLGIGASVLGQEPGQRPARAEGVEAINPCGRVPVSLIIDDSTCLVNMAHFGIPQFAEVFPDQYKQDWRKLPREIPDAFVRKFGQWCREHGVKGKYSIVPYPACVGWIDRFLPGWSKKELEESIKLVRELMMPDWDIHPEMVSHTRVIDTRTGKPYPEASPRYMENWQWTDGRSVDELATYLSYALRILQNAGFVCEGITTPGGFGSGARKELSQATLASCREVFKTEIPHYFRDLFTDAQSVKPRVEYAAGLDGDDPRCVVSIIGCTGDWFGGWDGLERGSADKFITADLASGRMVEVIEKGEPAIIVCHWPGVYFNGEEVGFDILKEVVKRLHNRYDHLIWMNLSEISRYWAAKELTQIGRDGSRIIVKAPFACPRFTLRLSGTASVPPRLTCQDTPVALQKASGLLELQSGFWYSDETSTTVCFDLPKGTTKIEK
jgi:hypothetical protein